MRIAVYCSAKNTLPENVAEDARRLGQWIGRAGHTLVYGGLDRGLMGVVARAAASDGATVIGVVPQDRIDSQHPDNSVNIMCATLHERKQTMEENADCFVALDGGIGTVDEVFSALATMTFFNEPKPIFMLNREGLYDPIYDLMGRMVTRQLATPPATRRIVLAPDMDTLIDALDRHAATLTD